MTPKGMLPDIDKITYVINNKEYSYEQLQQAFPAKRLPVPEDHPAQDRTLVEELETMRYDDWRDIVVLGGYRQSVQYLLAYLIERLKTLNRNNANLRRDIVSGDDLSATLLKAEMACAMQTFPAVFTCAQQLGNGDKRSGDWILAYYKREPAIRDLTPLFYRLCLLILEDRDDDTVKKPSDQYWRQWITRQPGRRPAQQNPLRGKVTPPSVIVTPENKVMQALMDKNDPLEWNKTVGVPVIPSPLVYTMLRVSPSAEFHAIMQSEDGLVQAMTYMPITYYEHFIGCVLMSMYKSHWEATGNQAMPFTLAHVYQTMTGDREAQLTPKIAREIVEALDKLRKIDMFINATGEAAARYGSRRRGMPPRETILRGNYLDIQEWTQNFDEFRTHTYWLVARPVMLAYSELNGQILSYAAEYLNIKDADNAGNFLLEAAHDGGKPTVRRKERRTSVIDKYVNDRLAEMKYEARQGRIKTGVRIKVATVCEKAEVNAEDRKALKRTRERIEAVIKSTMAHDKERGEKVRVVGFEAIKERVNNAMRIVAFDIKVMRVKDYKPGTFDSEEQRG